MARINVENDFWTDPKFTALAKKIGRFNAVGACVCLWHLGQRFYIRDGSPIPHNIYALEEFPCELEEFDLVERTEKGMRVRGSEDSFKWIRQKIEAGRRGGVESGKSRNQVLNRSGDEAARSGSNPPVPVLTPDLNIKLSHSPKLAVDGGGAPPIGVGESETLTKLGEIWNRERGPLAELRVCSHGRRRYAEMRWKEKPDEGYWTQIIRRLVKSPWCCGGNDRGWKADFDFLIKPETAGAILAGKYDPATAAPKPVPIMSSPKPAGPRCRTCDGAGMIAPRGSKEIVRCPNCQSPPSLAGSNSSSM